MASTYVNNLRLNEMATGDASGTWGTVTNTNLELIGEALGFGTEAITTNADTHTSTVADGATDPARAMYIKYTGTLDSACTITIAPNTLNRMHFIENGTSGSQNIIISQGSGANVTIPPGDTKAVYLDGAGSGAAVVEAFASLSVTDLKVQDDLTVTDDASVGGNATVTGVITGSTLEATGDTSAGDNAAIGYTSAEGLILTGQGSTSDITLKNDADATVFTVPTGTDDILFPDNAKAMFGAGSDMQIYHDGSNSRINDAGTGSLIIQTNTFSVKNAAGDEDILLGSENGAVTLYHDNAAKLATSSSGVTVTGTLVGTALDISGDIDVDGTTNLDNVDIDGTVDISSQTNIHSNLVLDDDNKIIIGNGSDLQIYHDGSKSYIDDAGTGDLVIRGSAKVDISKYTGEAMIHANVDSSVDLFFDNAVKLSTASGGVSITGTCTATTFSGSGASLTNLPASGPFQSAPVTANTSSTVSIGTSYTTVTSIAVSHDANDKVIIFGTFQLDTQSSSTSGQGDFRILASNTSQSVELNVNDILAESARLRWQQAYIARDTRGISAITTYHIQVRKSNGSMNVNHSAGTSTITLFLETV